MQDIELVNLGKQLSRFVVGTEGNISHRISDGFVIKASGRSFKDLNHDEAFVRCDSGGNPLPNENGKPSMEVSFHAWIYKNSDYRFVAHTHPTNVLKILCTHWADELARVRFFPDQVVFNGADACMVPYATPGEDLTNEIMNAATQYGSFPSLLLLKSHGIICCTNSVREAVTMTEICDKAAEIFIGAKLLGHGVCLTDIAVSEIQEHKDEIYRRDMS